MTAEPDDEAATTDGRLSALERKIRDARKPETKAPSAVREKYTAAALAWRMVTELVLSVIIGAAMGWGLDSLFGSKPLFLIVLTLLGFAAGVRMLMRMASADQRRRADGSADRPEGERHGSE